MTAPFDFSKHTQSAYDTTATVYADYVADLHPHIQADEFLAMMPEKGTVLDVGCGTGRDANVFSKKGCRVTGIDFSVELLSIARKTAPLAEFILSDIHHLSFRRDLSFDGVWANASLLHIEKSKIHAVLRRIHQLLRADGVLFLSLKKGVDEAFAQDTRFPNHDAWKFWSYYQEAEIAGILTECGFTIHHMGTLDSRFQTNPFIVVHAVRD